MSSALPATMRALTIRERRLVMAALPVPTVAAGEVLVRVAYTGVNRADVLQVEGSYAPPEGASPLPGLEVSGSIAALGDGVTGWRVGEEVCALLSGGGYAEYVAVPATQLLPLPTGVTLREAASLPEAAATAVMALVVEANLAPGERVLLHGGTSGVGILMGQIARAMGAEVFATVGNAAKAALLAPLGITPIRRDLGPFADQLLAATGGAGVDVVIDTLGAPHVASHFKLLRRGGRMVTLAMLDGNLLEPLKLSGFFMKNLRWSAATLRSQSPAAKEKIVAHARAQLWPHLVSGVIRPVIDSVFPWEEAEKAHQRMQERLHMGKILLEVQPVP